ncbi:MAG: GNAT family N-acetyltransferase [Lachnospiraceae bacterium]|jgi:RimJ/RimL family protein N-acetyltransferase|nr:GNAT family N-acetyltransferase [Lachnospiraceae bacterium]
MNGLQKMANGYYDDDSKCIIGEKLIFRPITPADTDRVISWRNSSHVRENFIYQQPFTREGHERWLETQVATGQAIQFIMCEKEGDDGKYLPGRPVGSCYLRDIDHEFRKAEYGMFIGVEDVKGMGYGSEAATYTIEYAFRVLKLHKVFSRIFATNIPSIKGCERAGMVREAYLKDEVRLHNKYVDIVLLARINEESTI